MPNNILITPGSASIQFSGSAANTIRLEVEASGSIAFYGNSGSLFGISDSLSGSLMNVNDISGLPILEVFSDDRVVMGSFNRNTLVVTGSRVGVRKADPTADLDVSGSVVISGSLTVTDTIIGTSSVATSASYGVTASYAETSSFAVTASHASSGDGYINFPEGLIVTGSIYATEFITGSGLLMTDRAASSASAGGTYTTAEQDLLNQIKDTLIKYGMLT